MLHVLPPTFKLVNNRMGSLSDINNREIRYALQKKKETLLLRDLTPALNENVCSEKLFFY